VAQTHYVKSFRGQRKCQYKPEGSWQTCDQPKAVHEELEHEFTQTPLTCNFCGKPINIGDPYKWVAPRAHRAAHGTKKSRHTTCPAWKPSELTSSHHLATIYAAQEDAEASMANLAVSSVGETVEVAEQLQEIAETFSEAIMEANESYTESADNIEEGFGHETYQSEELREKAEAVESWADEVSSFTVDDYDAEGLPCAECMDVEDADQHHDNKLEDYHEYDEDPSVLEEWLEEQVGELQELVGDMPL